MTNSPQGRFPEEHSILKIDAGLGSVTDIALPRAVQASTPPPPPATLEDLKSLAPGMDVRIPGTPFSSLFLVCQIPRGLAQGSCSNPR